MKKILDQRKRNKLNAKHLNNAKNLTNKVEPDFKINFMFVELLIAFIIYYILFSIRKKLTNITINVITFVILSASLLILSTFIDFEIRPFVCPISFLIIFNPYRYFYKKTTKKELIIAIRGEYKNATSAKDEIFSLVLFAIPIISILFFI